MNLAFPYSFNTAGRTAQPFDDDAHIKQMLFLLLFTSPGERVNLPTFGCGLHQLVFAPNSPELGIATKFTVQASIVQWLGDLITLTDVEVTTADSTITVMVQYVVRRTNRAGRAELTGTVG
jgi:hypothetical protein